MLRIDERPLDYEWMQERCQRNCAVRAALCIVAAALGADSVSKFGSLACFWAGILCALCSAYFFLIAPIENVVLAIVLFGCAVGLELVAALLKLGRDG
jgi:hypothetical protein